MISYEPETLIIIDSRYISFPTLIFNTSHAIYMLLISEEKRNSSIFTVPTHPLIFFWNVIIIKIIKSKKTPQQQYFVFYLITDDYIKF